MSNFEHINDGTCPICQKSGLIRLDAFELPAIITKAVLHENESYSHMIVAGRHAIVKLQAEEIVA